MADDGTRARLRGWWREHIGADLAAMERFDGVVAGYSEPHRRYHDVEHLLAVLGAVVELAGAEPVTDVGVIVAAGFYHDVIYEPLAKDNEERSALRAEAELTELGWSTGRARRVGDLVRATITHDTGEADVDTAVLLDADLAVLGRDDAAYARYLAAVREEYAQAGVDDRTWAAGRADVLRRLLDHDTRFATATGRRRWEAAARRHLVDELAALSSGRP